jgi:CRP-like cAMP-binding protein
MGQLPVSGGSLRVNEVYDNLCTILEDQLDSFFFLKPEDLSHLSGFFECKKMPAGSILWNEGDPCEYVAFIISGKVEVMKKTDLKENKLILGIYSEGTFVGVLCILDGSPRAVTAAALDDISLMLITKKNFEKLNTMHPNLGIKLMKGMLLSVSKRLKGSYNRLVQIF